MPRVAWNQVPKAGEDVLMVRPRAEQPTPAELEVLKVLWDRDGPATVREVLEIVNLKHVPPRAYTSVMSLMNVMVDKGLLGRFPRGRAFVYVPAEPRDQTLRGLLGETLERAYSGSASLLVAHLLDQSSPSAEELDQIRSLLDDYQSRGSVEPEEGGAPCKRSRPKRPRG
jgi:predicted transcriptional regulator